MRQTAHHLANHIVLFKEVFFSRVGTPLKSISIADSNLTSILTLEGQSIHIRYSKGTKPCSKSKETKSYTVDWNFFAIMPENLTEKICENL